MKKQHAFRALPLLLVAGTLRAPAATLPAYCGGVGATSYSPPSVTIPAVSLNRGTVITVTNGTMALNGDTSSVATPSQPRVMLPSAFSACATGATALRLGLALGGEIDIDPASEAMLEVPLALAVTQEDEGRHGLSLMCRRARLLARWAATAQAAARPSGGGRRGL